MPLSTNTTTSASVPATTRLKHEDAPCASSVTNVRRAARELSVLSASAMSSSGPSTSSTTSVPAHADEWTDATVSSNRLGEA